MDFIEIAKQAKAAALQLADLSTEVKDKAILAIADAIEANKALIFEANAKDLEAANGIVSPSVFNRLKLDENKMRDMVNGLRDVAALQDPVNKVILSRRLDEGLELYKVSCPIGVVGIIFEARPDVIAQISSLAIKSANAVILKGGTESRNTNKTVMEVINLALKQVDGFPDNALNQVFTREEAAEMLKCDEYIDLIIPRGGNSLVKFVKDNTRIPVLGHADGICHIFVDETADLEMAKNIVIDAKTQYPSACNAVETLLIHRGFLYKDELLKSLEDAGIILDSNPQNWAFEHGDNTLACKTINCLSEAVEHINTYGSGHTDCIVTSDCEKAETFMRKIDSAGVYHNVSTRFADGFRYGFGAEVGISTNKTHARGPVGLEGLTIYKYKLSGNGQIVKDYVEGLKQFNYKDLT